MNCPLLLKTFSNSSPVPPNLARASYEIQIFFTIRQDFFFSFLKKELKKSLLVKACGLSSNSMIPGEICSCFLRITRSLYSLGSATARAMMSVSQYGEYIAIVDYVLSI